MTNNIILYGPTLSGKTKIAQQFAKQYNYTIVNFDAYQVYKELPILTAADSEALFSQCYSVYDANYSIGEFIKWLKSLDKNRKYIFVGGSGLYANFIKNGIHDLPSVSKRHVERATELFFNNQIKDEGFVKDFTNPQRVIRDYSFFLETGDHLSEYFKKTKKFNFFVDSTFISIDKLHFDNNDITLRLNSMIDQGLFDEVGKLNLDALSGTAQKTLGLIDIIDYLNQDISFSHMKNNIIQKTKHLIKKQKVWHRGYFNYSNEIRLDEFLNCQFDFKQNYTLVI